MTITTKDLEAGGLKHPEQTGLKGGDVVGTKKKGTKRPKPKK